MRTTYGNAGETAPKPRRSKDRGGENNVEAVNALCERFGFRGVEFGNWMSQADRFAAVMRMHEVERVCEVFGWPGDAFGKIGPNGITIAFGARGDGGRMGSLGHFESSKNVINLTRRPKSLSGHMAFVHELGHAIDWHLGDGTGFWSHGSEWEAVMNKMPEHMLWSKLKNMPSRPSGRKKGYWTRPEEVFARSFEVYARSLGYVGPLGASKLNTHPTGDEHDIACDAIAPLFDRVTADIVGRK